MNEIKLIIKEEYIWILFEVLIISIHIWINGMIMASIRRKIFNKEFYEEKFHDYKNLNKVMTSDSGYPDDGQGRLADQLNNEEWFILNNYRRAHMNYVEGGLSIIIPLLISGLLNPRLTFLFGLIYIIGREIYSQGYRRSGSKGRFIGAMIIDFSLLVLWSMSIYSCFYLGNGFNGLKKVLF